MSSTATAWAAILFAGLGTYAIRAAFPAFAHRMTSLTLPTRRVLRMIPPATLAALALPALVAPEGSIDLTQPRLVAGFIGGAVGYRTRSAAWTLVVGMAALVVLDWPF